MQDHDQEVTAAEARVAYWRAAAIEANERGLRLNSQHVEALKWLDVGFCATLRVAAAREPVSASHWGLWER